MSNLFLLDDTTLLCNILFCSWVIVRNLLRDIDVVLCVATALALCSIKKRTAAVSKSGANQDNSTYMQISLQAYRWVSQMTTVLFCAIRRSIIDGIIKTSRIAKEIHSTIIRCLYITLHYVIWPLEVVLKTWNLSGLYPKQLELWCWRPVYCWADRQTVTDWVWRNTVYTPFSILHNISCQIIDTIHCATFHYYP